MRVYTFPNALTIIRLLVSPFIPALLIFQYDIGDFDFRLVASTIAIALALSDLDGALAKRLQQESNLGKILDPIADFSYCCSLFASVLIVYAHFSFLLLTCWSIFGICFLGYAVKVTKLRRLGVIESPNMSAKAAMCTLMISMISVLIGTLFYPSYGWHIVAVFGVVVSLILMNHALQRYKSSIA